jgi:hypothetical protein
MVVFVGIPAAGQRALMRDLARFGTNLLQVSAMPDQKPPVAFEPQAAAMAARMGPVTGTAAVANTRNPRPRWRRCSRPRRPARRRRSSGPTPRRRRRPGWRGADDNDDYNRCLVAHGEPLVKKDGKWVPGPGWDDWPPDPDMELACQAKAFDGKRG